MIISECGTPTRRVVEPILPSQMTSPGSMASKLPDVHRVILKPWQVLVGDGLQPDFDRAVVIENGRIAEVTSRPPEGETIELRDMTLLPGFIDAHVHIRFFDPGDVLRGGVTTVRDLAWPPRDIYPLAEESTDPTFDGPLILAVGPMLTAPGGYPSAAAWAPEGTGRVVENIDDARVAVRERVAEKAAAVKVALNAAVGPTLSLETLTAICEEAHAHGLRVTGHIFGLEELRKAVAAGIDELAHMLMSREEIPDSVFHEMVAKDVTCVPTLSIHGMRTRRIAIMNLAGFVDAGGRVVYGTDLGNSGPKPGIDRKEIDRMERSGMTGRAIVSSGTNVAASYLGLGTKGVIAPGKDADLIAVGGDPLDAPIALTDVRFVMRGGRVVRSPD